MKRKNKGNIWCRIFGWDKEEWKRIVRIWGIRLTYKGNRYLIRPGTWLWFFIYIGGALLAAFGFWASCALMFIIVGSI